MLDEELIIKLPQDLSKVFESVHTLDLGDFICNDIEGVISNLATIPNLKNLYIKV